jgi:hypothetical protein
MLERRRLTYGADYGAAVFVSNFEYKDVVIEFLDTETKRNFWIGLK